MIDQFERLSELLDTIPKLAVIETSEESTEEGHSLPAVIIDFEPGTIESLTEDGQNLLMKSSYSLVICVEKKTNRKQNRRDLNKLTKQIFSLLVGEYGEISYGSFYPATIPFGMGEALSYGVQITLPEEDFNLNS